MAAVFSMKVGQVGRISPRTRAVVDFAIDFEDSRSGTYIVTSVGVRQGVNAQFSLAFDESVYTYVFGDRPGDLIISGLAFLEACGPDGGAVSGVGNVLDYYNQNKASNRQTVVLIKFGPTTFQARLIDCNLEMLRPEQGAAQFTLAFKLMPSRTRKNPNAGLLAQDSGAANRATAAVSSIA